MIWSTIKFLLKAWKRKWMILFKENRFQKLSSSIKLLKKSSLTVRSGAMNEEMTHIFLGASTIESIDPFIIKDNFKTITIHTSEDSIWEFYQSLENLIQQKQKLKIKNLRELKDLKYWMNLFEFIINYNY